MRFGFMDHVPCASWQSEGQRYHDILAQIEVGDKVGFEMAWLAEIHNQGGLVDHTVVKRAMELFVTEMTHGADNIINQQRAVNPLQQ